MFAIYLGCETELVDFLLANKISPVVVDETNGYPTFSCHSLSIAS